MRSFQDKKGNDIKIGDTIRLNFYVRWREHPGSGYMGQGPYGDDVFTPDEGGLLEPEKHWIEWDIVLDGACTVAEIKGRSSMLSLSTANTYDEDMKKVSVLGSSLMYLTSNFPSQCYEIVRSA